MNLSFKPSGQRFQRSAVALAMAAACASASALPTFTLNLDAAIAGAPTADVTADNLIISDFSTVRVTGTTFTDAGFLNVTSFQLGSAGATVQTPGLGSTYGLYFKFTGEGTTSTGNPATVFTSGNFTKLDYQLFGYTGPANFGFTASNDAIENVSGDVLLASGSLINGTVSSSPGPTLGLFSPSASAALSFNIAPGAAGFFAQPATFYNMALAAFINTPSQVSLFSGGFRITQGGGTVNFANTAPIPEPETYALMLAGLAAVSFMARRRRRQD